MVGCPVDICRTYVLKYIKGKRLSKDSNQIIKYLGIQSLYGRCCPDGLLLQEILPHRSHFLENDLWKNVNSKILEYMYWTLLDHIPVSVHSCPGTIS